MVVSLRGFIALAARAVFLISIYLSHSSGSGEIRQDAALLDNGSGFVVALD